jgi:hypothetical protein
MRPLYAIVFTLSALVACGTPAPAPTEEVKPAETTPPTDATPAAGTPDAKPADAAATGVTKESLTAATNDFPALASWNDAMARVEPKLGKPMKVEGDVSMWYAKDGDQCTILTVTKMGEIVGGATVAAGPCPAP